jgi:hypothetical protein
VKLELNGFRAPPHARVVDGNAHVQVAIRILEKLDFYLIFF